MQPVRLALRCPKCARLSEKEVSKAGPIEITCNEGHQYTFVVGGSDLPSPDECIDDDPVKWEFVIWYTDSHGMDRRTKRKHEVVSGSEINDWRGTCEHLHDMQSDLEQEPGIVIRSTRVEMI